MHDGFKTAARLAALERRVRGLPSRFAGGGAPAIPYYYLTIGQGNLLQTVSGVDYYGLKRPASPVVEVPSVSPGTIPFVSPGSYPDGLSEGWLGGALVWVGLWLKPNVWDGGVQIAGDLTLDDFPGELPYNTPCFARSFLPFPVTGSPGVYANVYNPWAI